MSVTTTTPPVLGKRGRRASITTTTTKRRRTGGRRSRISRAIVPKVYRFQRTFSQIVNAGDLPAGWFITTETPSALVSTIAVNLADLPNYSEFANLFQLYRLTKIESVFVPGWNPNLPDPSNGVGANILVRWKSNRTGQAMGTSDTNEAWNQCQMVKRGSFSGTAAKPLSVKQKLNQLAETYASTVNTDYGVVTPRWLSTTEVNAGHYGYDIRFDVCQDILAINPGGSYRNLTFRLDHVVTLECKGVQ